MKTLYRWTAAFVLCALTPASVLPAAAHTGGLTSTPTPRQMIAQYFDALNAHRYHAAWRLEAPCGVTLYTSNGQGAPKGSEGYEGRGSGPWRPGPPNFARHPILASAHVTKITWLRIPLFARYHVLAFGVSGWYTFDYSRVPWANMTHKNGFHTVKIAMWRCNGKWGLEGYEWLTGSGGELTWT
jgi:hypothetical protein